MDQSNIKRENNDMGNYIRTHEMMIKYNTYNRTSKQAEISGIGKFLEMTRL